MKITLTVSVAALFALAVPGLRANLILDSFETGGFLTGAPDTRVTVAADALGGDRYTNIQETGVGGTILLVSTGGGGRLNYNGVTDTTGYFEVGYGYADAVGTLDDLNLSLAAYDRFRFDFSNNEYQTPLVLTVRSGVAGANVATASTTVGAGYTGSVDILLSSFVDQIGSVDWTSVDQITFRLDPPAQGDTTLLSVSVVPEPSGLLLLGLAGVLALGRRRRRG